MRLLFLIHAYPPDVIGGHEVRCQRTVEGLRQRGHEVLVLTTYRRENGPRKDGHVWRLLRSKWSEDPKRTALKWVGVYRHNVRTYQRTLQEFQPDLVCQWNLNWCTAAFVQYVHVNTPVPIVTFAGGPMRHDDLWFHFCRTPASGVLRRILKRLVIGCASPWIPVEPKPIHYKVVTFNSPFVRDWCLQKNGVKVERPVVIYGGVDVQRFPPRSPDDYCHPPRFLFTGRIDPEKDPMVCLSAVERLVKKGLPVQLTIAAGSSLHPDYERAFFKEAKRFDGVVRLVNKVSPQEMSALLHQHDVFLFPSHLDWFPNALLEAMACGLAVIATRCGGPDEILVDGENCLIFPTGDAEALAERMERLINDPALVVRLGQNAQKLVRTRFTIERYLDEVEALLESVKREA